MLLLYLLNVSAQPNSKIYRNFETMAEYETQQIVLLSCYEYVRIRNIVAMCESADSVNYKGKAT